MQFLITIPSEAVTRLSPEAAVNILHALLGAEISYAKLRPSMLTISERLTVADGGIDSEIDSENAIIPADCLFAGGLTGFQIKSGASFKPWTKGSIEGELLDSKKRLLQSVHRLIQEDGDYIVICTGHDLTPQQRNKARDLIKSAFHQCGFLSYRGKIDVLGASQIAEYAARYPGVAAMLGIDPIQDAWVFQQWERDAHLSNLFKVDSEQEALINKVQNALRGDIKHVRILGEAGLGKTRLLLEALRPSEFSVSVLYIVHGSGFGQSALFRYLLKTEHRKPLIVILDDLSEFELTDIWRHLKNRCGHLRLISLDHGHDVSQDEDILRLQAPRLSDQTIERILSDRAGELRDLRRWVEVCEGSPRVAQAVGDNLRANPADLLRPPSTVPIWDRFLHGHGKRDEILTRQIDCVTSHLALFSRFGFEAPVQSEAAFIAKLIEQVDPTIGFARFQQIVKGLRDRRVLQGSKTLFFVPKALHIYLWKHFWDQYGSGFRFIETFSSMPESLHAWFMNMFKYAGDATAHVIEEILKADGVYADSAAIMSAKGSHFLSILAEANPAAVLRLLEHTIGGWPDDVLREFKDNRQNIVWTLEKISVWAKYTVRAMNLLALLARNENATYSNNATGVLSGLFRIGPEWAATESTPQQRLPALLRLMRSPIETEKRLALEAIKAALDSGGLGFRMVGPEHQGMKERANLWIPPTYRDWWDARTLYFNALIDETNLWDNSLRKEVCTVLLEVAEQQLTNPQATEISFSVIETLMADPCADASKVNHFFYHWLEYRNKGQHEEIAYRIRKLQQQFAKKSLASRFQRYVIDVDHLEWDQDSRERLGKIRNHCVSLVKALAKRVAKSQQTFDEIRHLLAPQKNATALWYFGQELAKYDAGRLFLDQLVSLALQTKHQVCLHAYLTVLRPIEPMLAQTTLNKLINHLDHAWLGVTLVLRSDFDDELFVQCLIAYDKGWIEANQFRVLRWGRVLNSFPSHRVGELMEKLHRELSLDSIVTLIELASGLPFDDNAPFEPQLVYEALVAALPHLNKGQHGFEDSWKEVSKRLIEWKVTYAMPLLDKLLDCMGDDYRASYDFAVAPLATELLRQNPAEGWIIITRQLEETLPKWRSDLQNWLKGCHSRMDSDNERLVPIAYVNQRAVLDWIDVDPESRSVLIAHAAPRTLADEIGGVLTRELITLYGHFKGVLNGISAIFGSGGWTGPTSVYLRGRRDIFRSWLAADFSPEVTQWIESEIDDLDRDISRAEIEEERSRFD